MIEIALKYPANRMELGLGRGCGFAEPVHVRISFNHSFKQLAKLIAQPTLRALIQKPLELRNCIVIGSVPHSPEVKPMAWKTSRNLLLIMALACAALVSAQPAAPGEDATSPRHFDAWYLGTDVVLGPEWLFSADDNPAYASPAYDDSGWKTVSIDKPLESYAPANIRFAWYRLHIAKPDLTRGISANAFAVETQYIQGGYELWFNGVRIGAAGMKVSGYENQDYLTSFDIPNSAAAANGDTVVAIRLAVNRNGQYGPGTSIPFKTGSVILSTRYAAQRDSSYVAAHETFILFMLAGLALVVGLVALALYVAMRNRLEYLAIAVSMLALSAQGFVEASDHLHLFTLPDLFFENLFLGINVVAGVEFVRLLLHLRRSRWLLALEIVAFLGYFGDWVIPMGLSPVLPAVLSYFVPSVILNTVLPVLLFRGVLPRKPRRPRDFAGDRSG